MQLYPTPFSRAYWRDAVASSRNLRNLVFAAEMIAAAIVLGMFYVPVADNLRLTISFMARAVCVLVCGPVLGVIYAVAEDLLSFAIHPTGPFFPGYTLSTVLACFIYALCFYRAKITIARITMAKVITNYAVNVLLGSLWSSMLYGKGYLYYAAKSLIKNTLYLPVQVLMLVVAFQVLLPILARDKRIPSQIGDRIVWFGDLRRSIL